MTENKFIEMVENANSIILRMDTAGNVTYFKKFAEEFFGFTRHEILGKNVVGTIESTPNRGTAVTVSFPAVCGKGV